MSIDATCKCESPEPALINHGLDSVCEKCGRLIAPLSPDAQTAEARFQRLHSQIHAKAKTAGF